MALTDKQAYHSAEIRRFRLNCWAEKVRFGLGFGVLVSLVVFGFLQAIDVSRETANSAGIVTLFVTMFASLVFYRPEFKNDQNGIKN
jgi:hypothetical protein